MGNNNAQKMDVAPRMCACSVTQFCPTLRPPWTAACQAPPSMEFSRQKSWSRNHFLLQRIFLTEGLSLHLLPHLHWQADSSQLVPPGKPSHSRYHLLSSKHTGLTASGTCQEPPPGLSTSQKHLPKSWQPTYHLLRFFTQKSPSLAT